MHPTLLLLVYGAAIVLVSLMGGWIPIYIRLTHRRMQIMSSLVAGFMLGVALLILLPHALMAVEVGMAMGFLILGLLLMFFLERFFAYHHHDVPQGLAIEPGHDHTLHEALHGDHDHTHAEHQTPHQAVASSHVAKLSWAGAATGLVLHSLIDGVAVAAAVYADVAGHGSFWPGFVVFLVVALHRPLDAMTLLTLTARTGWPERRRHLINAAFALAVPLGSFLFVAGISGGSETARITGYAIALSAGVFLCVSLSDLLPELQFHSHDRIPLSAALLVGLAFAALVYAFDSRAHDHTRHVPASTPIGELDGEHHHDDHNHP